MKKSKSGFLLAGLAGKGRPGYLFIPYTAVQSLDPYALGQAYGARAIFFERPELEFMDQPLRFVHHMPGALLSKGVQGSIIEIAFLTPEALGLFMGYHLRIAMQPDIDVPKVVAGASSAPEGIPGIREGTLLEVYQDLAGVDHRPWSLRARAR